LPVIAHVLAEALRALTVPFSAAVQLGLRLRVDGRLSGELRWDFDQRLANQHCNRIEVRTESAKP
jgi:hypothetical protein